MTDVNQMLASRLTQRFQNLLQECTVSATRETRVSVGKDRLIELCRSLRDDPEFSFEQLIDVCGVDYSTYGASAWQGPRFAVVYHLISYRHNQRLRVKVFVDEREPIVPSVVDIWASANWYEREAYDLFGILFDGHPDLRRLLTDYGFIGHPFRKDFPLIGNVEMRYDPEKQRVVYEPVSIEPRITVPRIIRHDNRYLDPAGATAKSTEVKRG
ncbi:MAG: NADH-quinone oxidoreductase subunit C [Gammaproteobacteria bacterium]|nr:MAG: NADH-quinone oxidoreductase subunit C [Gammaproteobacteria bacterium]TND04785.1 MAG: NADH-quinone oxidoreductase subunit C [Gammaproteobacteria bacterium]